ncbi:MAG: hypothetical protein LQ340_002735 [Diploschistes diacapsis]|nr:MAG: hypothetical protein LQ340_002735 [Diploschistes diacapsis]
MADNQKKLQALSEDFQNLQLELQSNIDARQKLESQQQENKSVQKEFTKLSEDAGIYKLVGPVLLKQDRSEAVMAVDQRLEFIDKEMARIDVIIKATQDNVEKKRSEMVGLQSSMQQPNAAKISS